MDDPAEVRVLLVVANPLSRRGLTLIIDTAPDLRTVGAHVDVRRALAECTVGDCDVVVVDLRGRSSSALQRYQRLLEGLPGVPLMILSGTADALEVLDAVASGARGYLLDDVSPEELTHAVRTVASGQTVISMTAAARVGRAEAGPKPQAAAQDHPALSARELEVLALLERGMRNREVARALTISENTVKNHVRSLFKKLDAHSRAEAIAQPRGRGLLDDRAREAAEPPGPAERPPA